MQQQNAANIFQSTIIIQTHTLYNNLRFRWSHSAYNNYVLLLLYLYFYHSQILNTGFLLKSLWPLLLPSQNSFIKMSDLGFKAWIPLLTVWHPVQDPKSLQQAEAAVKCRDWLLWPQLNDHREPLCVEWSVLPPPRTADLRFTGDVWLEIFK